MGNLNGNICRGTFRIWHLHTPCFLPTRVSPPPTSVPTYIQSDVTTGDHIAPVITPRTFGEVEPSSVRVQSDQACAHRGVADRLQRTSAAWRTWSSDAKSKRGRSANDLGCRRFLPTNGLAKGPTSTDRENKDERSRGSRSIRLFSDVRRRGALRRGSPAVAPREVLDLL